MHSPAMYGACSASVAQYSMTNNNVALLISLVGTRFARARMASVTTNEDNTLNAKSPLVVLSIKILAKCHPRGLTARELVEELASEDSSIELTPSLLSSKFNALFRRLHGDGEPSSSQLRELPLTRQLSDDKRKRLVYFYVPMQEATPESDGPEKPNEVPVALEETKEEPEFQEKEIAPVALSTPPLSSTSPKREAPEEPLERTPEPSRKKFARSKQVNPYYDSLTFDNMPFPRLATAPQSPAWDAHEFDENEFVPPESIQLDELDLMIR